MAANIDVSKMKKLLALDLPQVAVANALGCSEGFVSQQLADPAFSAEVAAMRLAKLEEASSRDAKLDHIESTIIDKLDKSINFMLKPAELLNALKIVSSVQRRTASNGINPAGNQLGTVVQITLPNVAAIAFIKNQQGEIIEAGGRALTTLPSHVLKSMVTTHTQLQLAGAQQNDSRFKAAGRESAQAVNLPAAEVSYG